ncbi:MAG: hypothetical protein JNM17_34725 [Archangium sp.]|nr:hypothetical protein [Archangium sp.]
MLALTLSLVAVSATPVRITTAGFTATGTDAALAKVWTERFAEVARRDGRLEITTAGDVEQLLSIERQKQLIGCSDMSSECLIELANALGADGVLVGSVVKSESGYLATLRVLQGRTGKVWWSTSDRRATESALLDWLDERAVLMVDALVPRAANPGPVIVGAAGGAALAAGATLIIISNTASLEAVRMASLENLGERVESGRTLNATGFVVAGVGAAALAAGVIWGLVGGKSDAPKVAVVPTRDGAVIGIGGTW